MLAVNLVQGAIGVTAVLAMFIALATFVEKVWSPLSRWLGKVIDRAFISPLATAVGKLDKGLQALVERMMMMSDDISELRSDVAETRRELEEHRRYVYTQLGPNGDTKPIHERLISLEKAHDIEDKDEP